LSPEEESDLRKECESIPLWELAAFGATEPNEERRKIVEEIWRKRDPSFDEAKRNQEEGIIYDGTYNEKLLEQQIKKYTKT